MREKYTVIFDQAWIAGDEVDDVCALGLGRGRVVDMYA